MQTEVEWLIRIDDNVIFRIYWKIWRNIYERQNLHCRSGGCITAVHVGIVYACTATGSDLVMDRTAEQLTHTVFAVSHYPVAY